MKGGAVQAAIAALSAEAGSVEVVGESALAESIRSRLDREPPPGGRPSAIVDATGNLEAVRRAMERVADLGTVVLAAPLDGSSAYLDLYADLHVRGLTVIGVSVGGSDPE